MHLERMNRQAGSGFPGVGILTSFFLIGFGLAGCGDSAEADAGAEVGFERVINVEVLTLAPRSFEERIQVTGTVQANRDVTLSAEEAGAIREILVEKGSSVSEGEPLFRIDDRILQSQLREAEARSELARETWDRRRRLFEEDGVGAELAYLEARYQAEQAEAILVTLRERLDRTVVRSPIAGVLESRTVEVGTLVGPGTPVARVVQINPVKILGGVPERFAGQVTRSSNAVVSFDVLRGETFPGRVQYVGSTVNPANRTFDVEVLISNPGMIAKPEMIATIDIVRGASEEAIVVPQEALVRVEEGFVVFVATSEGGSERASVRPVVLGASQRNEVVIEEGLVAGDRLIVVGQTSVANGDRVQITRTRETSAEGVLP
jgi:RND family efflux transporter MFP subunit